MRLVLSAIIAWWNTGGCYRVVSKEEREQHRLEVERQTAEGQKEQEAENVRKTHS